MIWEGGRGLIVETMDNSLSCRKPAMNDRLVEGRRSSSIEEEKMAEPMWDSNPDRVGY